jgi:hypothetical protein
MTLYATFHGWPGTEIRNPPLLLALSRGHTYPLRHISWAQAPSGDQSFSTRRLLPQEFSVLYPG